MFKVIALCGLVTYASIAAGEQQVGIFPTSDESSNTTWSNSVQKAEGVKAKTPKLDRDAAGRITAIHLSGQTIAIRYGADGVGKYPTQFRLKDDGEWIPLGVGHGVGPDMDDSLAPIRIGKKSAHNGSQFKITQEDYNELIMVIGELGNDVGGAWSGFDNYYGAGNSNMMRNERILACKDICDDTAMSAGLLCAVMGMANTPAGIICGGVVIAAQQSCRAKCDQMP